MKSRMFYVLLMVLLSASITACSSSKANFNPNNSSSVSGSEISQTSSPTSSSSPASDGDTNTEAPAANHSVLDAYKAVLLNNAEFFSIDNQRKLTLDDFLTNQELYGVVFKVTRFTVLDLDGDKAPEVVLELTVANNPEFYEVLHDVNGTVYGYNLVYRGLEALKTDGTFLYSNGAADNGYGKLSFQADAYETEILGYTESSQSNTGITIAYFIDNKSVTEEAYQSFSQEQDGKDDVVWYEFSQENVETQLSVNP